MIELYKNIKKKRQSLGISQDELAKKTGYSGKSMIARIESGDVDLPQSKIMLFARALDVSPSDLMGWDEHPTPTYDAAAGNGRIGDGAPTGESNLRVEEDQVVVTVRGRSMEPTLMDGDQVIVEPTSVPEDHSKIYLVKVNGEEHTLKRVEKKEDGLVLIGDNMAEYAPRLFTAKEVKETPVTIEGVVVRLVRDM